ncbi:hypothetical protein GYB22_04550, partial [bacterium]|nr:hypothetical protein [bacterium]
MTLKIKSIFTLAFLFSLIGGAKADHIIGSDITYTCGDTAGIYYVTFNFYRDCNGCYVLGQSPKCGTSENCASSQTAPTSLSARCATSGSSFGTVTMSRTSIVDITTTCSGSKSRCEQPCNGSFPYGIEKHTFKGRADLRSALNSSCCNIEISVLLYVRNVGITTGQSQQTFYTSCEINICNADCNSSPTLTNDPVAILCCNQPYSFNNGAVDTSDYDSLSYAFAPALRGAGQFCTYSANRTYLNPISSYYPGSLSWPYANPNSSPPIGISLNPQTGDLIFTPVQCNEIAVVVIQITEWRKDSTGTYKKVGVTRRDMQFIVMNCPDNNPPEVDGPYTYDVCAGNQICFDVTTDDEVYTPPPPAQAPPPDTVTISWNGGIPGATFTVTNPTARLQTGQFCWTPEISQASDLPYTFTVTARDNACPLNAVTVRSFRVRVKHRAQATVDIDTLPCSRYTVESTPISGFRGAPSYRWQILDSNLNIVTDKRKAHFASTGTFLSIKKQDTLLFREGGFYIIQHTINNSPQNCPYTYYDTLKVPKTFRANLSFGKDTFICAATTLRIEPYIYNGQAPYDFQWATMGVDDEGKVLNNATIKLSDTLPYYNLTLPIGQYDTAIALFARDGSGCTSVDTITVFQKQNPRVYLPEDPRICTYDSVLIIPSFDTAYWVDRMNLDSAGNPDTIRQGDTLFKKWFLNGASSY